MSALTDVMHFTSEITETSNNNSYHTSGNNSKQIAILVAFEIPRQAKFIHNNKKLF